MMYAAANIHSNHKPNLKTARKTMMTMSMRHEIEEDCLLNCPAFQLDRTYMVIISNVIMINLTVICVIELYGCGL
jgi:hypothetical protein